MEQGTRDLVDAAKAAGVRRFVLMSALGTTAETKDLVPYYHAKWDMEQTVAGSGLEHVTFRPSFVFGADGGILPTFKRIAKLTPVTPITGRGTQRIQPIWVDDGRCVLLRRGGPAGGREPSLRARGAGPRDLERAVGTAQARARRAAAEHARPDGVHARERALDGAAPGKQSRLRATC